MHCFKVVLLVQINSYKFEGKVVKTEEFASNICPSFLGHSVEIVTKDNNKDINV